MKKILVCCTNAVATSTFVVMKIKKKLSEKGMSANIKNCSVLEVNRVAKSFKPDFIVSNVGKESIKVDVPVINGIPILSGNGDEEIWNQIFEEMNN